MDRRESGCSEEVVAEPGPAPQTPTAPALKVHWIPADSDEAVGNAIMTEPSEPVLAGSPPRWRTTTPAMTSVAPVATAT